MPGNIAASMAALLARDAYAVSVIVLISAFADICQRSRTFKVYLLWGAKSDAVMLRHVRVLQIDYQSRKRRGRP
jgi:hypothetical protein